MNVKMEMKTGVQTQTIQALDFLRDDKIVFKAEVLAFDPQMRQARVILSTQEEIVAYVALSCMILPEEKDNVLMMQMADGTCYLLAVLERVSDQPLVLGFEQELIVSAPDLKYEIQGTIETHSANYHQIVEKNYRQYAKNIEVSSVEENRLSEKANFNFAQFKMVSKMVSWVTEHLFETLGFVNRSVENIEIINSNERRDKIKVGLDISAGHIKIDSKSDIQMNAHQIFMN